MTHVALITTTINVPTVLETHARYAPSDVTLSFVVAGDVQTPLAARELVEGLGGTYLGVADERAARWESSALIGERSIQRRNLALLHALTLGPDVVVTVDDDNRPLDPPTYLASFVDGFRRDASVVTSSSTGWYNPAHVLDPPVHHRGYPLDQRRNRGTYYTGRRDVTMSGGPGPARVGVVAGLWFGDPDVDALERIASAPHVVGFRAGSGPRDVVLDVATWAPFNTQNTAFAWEIAPLMQCLVGVGRFDDIWASYVARRVMDDLNWTVRYGHPLVVQERNQHDLLVDLDRELYGYRHTPALVHALRDLDVVRRERLDEPLDALELVYDALGEPLPEVTRRANRAWVADARVAVDEGRRRRKERGVD